VVATQSYQQQRRRSTSHAEERMNSTLLVVAAGSGLLGCGLAGYHWRATFYKAKLYARSLLYLFFSGDNTWKVTQVRDPDTLDPEQGGRNEKRDIIFIRHGESQWNETFNRSWNPIYFFPRLIYSCLFEVYLLLSGERDSWFYDSPLSPTGIKQAEELRRSITRATSDPSSTLNILSSNSSTPSTCVSSPLRRALSTEVIGLYDKLQSDETEKILILPQLQEISRNMDTLAITPPHTTPLPSWIELALKNLDIFKFYNGRTDVTLWKGDKPVRESGLSRLLEFNDWLFGQPSDHVVIAAGHSLWFRSYFRTFLPHSSHHKSTVKKMKNCAVVRLTVYCISDGDGNRHYKIEESSILEAYLGFE